MRGFNVSPQDEQEHKYNRVAGPISTRPSVARSLFSMLQYHLTHRITYIGLQEILHL